MFRKTDYIIMGLICFVLGFAVVSQYFVSKKVDALTQPETNDVMALEIEKVAKNNASLKLQVSELTKNYNDYSNVGNSKTVSREKVMEEESNLDAINGLSAVTGQGVKITIEGELTTANTVDLADALKNIGAGSISMNNIRINLNTFLAAPNYSSPITVVALGNANTLESALNRKGGIVEQISSKNVKITVEKSDSLTVPSGVESKFVYGKIVN